MIANREKTPPTFQIRLDNLITVMFNVEQHYCYKLYAFKMLNLNLLGYLDELYHSMEKSREVT